MIPSNSNDKIGCGTAGDLEGELTAFSTQLVVVRIKGQFVAEMWGPSSSGDALASSKQSLLRCVTYREVLARSRRVVHRLGDKYAVLFVQRDVLMRHQPQELHQGIPFGWIVHVQGTTRLPRARSQDDVLNLALETDPLPAAVVLRNPYGAVDLFWVVGPHREAYYDDQRRFLSNRFERVGRHWFEKCSVYSVGTTDLLRAVPLQSLAGGARLEHIAPADLDWIPFESLGCVEERTTERNVTRSAARQRRKGDGRE